MTGMSQDELGSWVDAITRLHTEVSAGRAEERAVDHAVANLWSGFGFPTSPPTVVDLVIKAVETGYLAALRDIRDGKLDTGLIE